MPLTAKKSNAQKAGNVSKSDENEESEIQKFFSGRSVLITGCTGFLGTVLLAVLLMHCPGLVKAYVLLREKNGMDIEARKEKLFNKKIFLALKEWNPDVLDKVACVRGDVSEDNLGIRSSDMPEIIENVSVALHCAADVNFNKPLRYAITHNTRGTENVVIFCRKIKHLVSLVYTSTVFSFCNKNDLYEIVQEMQVSSREFIDAARRGDEEKLEQMFQRCTPPWPNTYTISKAIAENYLSKEAKDLPVIIIRPSIIFASWKSVLPGYIEEGTGMIDACLAVAKGFGRVVHCDPNNVLDIVPVDLVANTILGAAWYVHAKRPDCLIVANCVGSPFAPLKVRDLLDMLFKIQKVYPLPRMYQTPQLTLIKNTVVYWASSIVNHYAPALFIDFILILMGNKPKLTKLYIFYDKSFRLMSPFIMTTWNFQCDNFKMLEACRSSKDKKLFPMVMTDDTVVEMSNSIKTGSSFYDWRIDKRKMHERLSIAHKRYLMTTTLKWLTIALLTYLISKVFMKLCDCISTL